MEAVGKLNHCSELNPALEARKYSIITYDTSTVDSRLSARGLTALRLNRGNVFLKKKFYFP
jgi:hypothetical protein